MPGRIGRMLNRSGRDEGVGVFVAMVMLILLAGAVGLALFGGSVLFRTLAVVPAVLTVLVGVVAMTVTVDDGHVGVVKTFGAYDDTELNPGLKLIWPWEDLEEVDLRERAVYYGESDDGSGQAGGRITAQAAGGGNLTFDATIQLAPRKGEVVALLRQVGPDWWPVIGQSAARSCLRDSASRVSLDEAITTGRDEISRLTIECLVGEDGQGGKIGDNGIEVYGVDIRDVDPGTEVIDAINRRQVAAINVETANEELQKANIDAKTEAVEALAISNSEQIVACGGEPVFAEGGTNDGEIVDVIPSEDCADQFTAEYLQWLYIQQLSEIDGVVVIPPTFDDQLFLNLDAGSGAATTPAPSESPTGG